ncbi:TonB-dependent receptor [Alteromonas aestuariivivens]|uniref:TonB-dependent receptor n=1 Tax=Alteromonas aestuariivivens TaxID=1938339 RepID=A0A3D8M6D0_9ALTE|nr:TonB-dependent receptor [Alteromonas aestuariivivens]RDV25130.1 TonB-dependent receptor [Alteromonas aestuariivivens]
MYKNTKLAKSVKLAMAFGALSASMVASTAALAQEENAIEEEKVEKISVTGSRIARTDLVATSPINVFDEQVLEISGVNDIQSFINELPSAGVPGSSDTNSNFSTVATGVNTVNLRNLGSTRTLILVNGRRHVGGLAGSPVVDVSMIPMDMIDRVEVVTGGASAVYGSEAMAGVINFIMKDDFEGLNVHARYGDSVEGGGIERDISFMAGGNFDGDKGNAIIYGGISDSGILKATDRKISEADAVNSSFGPKGNFFIGNQLTTLDEDTGLWNKPFVAAEDGFNRNARRLIRVPTKRIQFNANVDYEVNEHLNFFSESAYSDVSSESSLEPTIMGEFISVGGVPNVRMPLDNAFMPDELRDAALALDPDATELVMFRRFTELDNRRSDTQRRVFRTAVGVEGIINDYWDYEVYYQYGKMGQDQVNTGVANAFNVLQALDTEVLEDGTVQCADALARSLGCVPINFFGEGTVDGAALDYVAVQPQTTSRMEQQVFGATVTGIVAELPAGDLGVAFGYERRSEESSFNSDALAQTGLTTGNTTPNVTGDYQVQEYFAEAIVPIFADAPLMHYLGLELAYRYADYSTIGGADATKIAVDWQPIEDLKVRGGYSTAVRAPFIDELYDPGSETFRNFVDPCALGGAGGVSASGDPDDVYTAESTQVQANCATIPGTATLDPFAMNIRSAGGLAAGNPDLHEEESETVTFGFAYSPSAIENLNLTVDYFNIKIDDAISTFTAQTTVDQCVRQSSFPDNPFCDLVSRDPNTGLVLRIDALAINAAQFEAEGIDFAVDYSIDVGPGNLRANVIGSYSTKNEYTPFIGGEPVDSQGEIGVPDLRVNAGLTYQWEDLTVNWSTRYIDRVNIENDRLDFGEIGTYLYHDIQARYVLDAEGKYEVYAGIDNIFDKEPPVLGQGIPGDVTGTNTAADVYDAIRTYWYVGVEARF